MKRFAAAATLAVALPVAAQEIYAVDADHTYPSFEVLHLGMSLQRGQFTKVTGKITLDRAAKKGAADITLDMSGILTGNTKLADHLRAADFFEVEKFPTATFKANDFRFEGDKLAAVAGELTLKGVTRPVTLTVTGFNCGAHPFNKKAMCGANATATLRRSDFGVKYALSAVGDEVRLSIPVEAYRD